MRKIRTTHLPFVLSEIYREFGGLKTELVYETPFQFLIAVILSAQTTDKQVNATTPAFFQKVREPRDLLGWTLPEIEQYLGSVNYYRNKCRFILESAKMLDREFSGVIPNSLNEIQRLPGVGIKTAKVVLSVLYDAPYVGVDTHVHRVLNRIGIVQAKTPEQTDAMIEKGFTLAEKLDSHHSLVLFGRYRCTARTPKCEQCRLQEVCEWYKKRATSKAKK